MGINRYNGEGYSDPTAFEAIRNSECFRITHPTGYLELNTEKFFPCTVEKGKKVFKLVREHCSEAQKQELLALLLRKAKFYADTALRLDSREPARQTGTSRRRRGQERPAWRLLRHLSARRNHV